MFTVSKAQYALCYNFVFFSEAWLYCKFNARIQN